MYKLYKEGRKRSCRERRSKKVAFINELSTNFYSNNSSWRNKKTVLKTRDMLFFKIYGIFVQYKGENRKTFNSEKKIFKIFGIIMIRCFTNLLWKQRTGQHLWWKPHLQPLPSKDSVTGLFSWNFIKYIHSFSEQLLENLTNELSTVRLHNQNYLTLKKVVKVT